MVVVYGELPRAMTGAATQLLAESLLVEPGYRHIVPDEAERRLLMRHMIGSMLATARREGKVWAATENNVLLGAGIWLKPGAYPPGRWDTVRSWPHQLGLMSLGREKLRLLNQMEANTRQYFPATPCWYLEILGIDPATQGRGIGSGLLAYMLAEIGPYACYLETATPANLRFYERAGFHIVEPAARLAPGDGPTHWTMMRNPQ